jgi:hypothetical protein
VQLSNANPDGVVDDLLMKSLEVWYTDGQIVELAMVTAILVGMAKMLFALKWADKVSMCAINPPKNNNVNG